MILLELNIVATLRCSMRRFFLSILPLFVFICFIFFIYKKQVIYETCKEGNNVACK